MPDHEWACDNCGEMNPPYTEVCRDCYRPPKEAAVTVAGAVKDQAPSEEPTLAPKEPDVLERIERLPSHKKPFAYLFFGVGALGYFVSELYPELGVSLVGLAVAVLASMALSLMFPKIHIPKVQLPKRFLAKRRMGNQDGGV